MRLSLSPKLLAPKLLAATVLAAGFGTPASAHVGDHSHMSFGELASHLASRPEHMIVVACVALLAGAVTLSAAVKRRKAHARSARSRGTPAT